MVGIGEDHQWTKVSFYRFRFTEVAVEITRYFKGKSKQRRWFLNVRFMEVWALSHQFFAFFRSWVWLIFMRSLVRACPEFQVLFEPVLKKACNARLMFLLFLLAVVHLLSFRSIIRPSSQTFSCFNRFNVFLLTFECSFLNFLFNLEPLSKSLLMRDSYSVQFSFFGGHLS